MVVPAAWDLWLPGESDWVLGWWYEYFGPVGEKPELLRRDRISFAVNKRPVLAVPSHLRSENILQEKVELLH